MHIIMEPEFFAIMYGDSQHLFLPPPGWRFRDYSPSAPGPVAFFNITNGELGHIIDECRFVRMDDSPL